MHRRLSPRHLRTSHRYGALALLTLLTLVAPAMVQVSSALSAESGERDRSEPVPQTSPDRASEEPPASIPTPLTESGRASEDTGTASGPAEPASGSGPEITRFDPPVRLAAGERTVFTWRLVDPSGVQHTTLSVGWSSGIYTACGFGQSASLVAGTVFDGTWELSCTFPATAPATTYSLQVAATNNEGLLSLSPWRELRLEGANDDISPPTYSSVRADAPTRPGGSVTVRWAVSDASAISGAIMWAASPDGYRFADDAGRPFADYSAPVSEDCNASRTECSLTQVLTLAAGVPAGTWVLWVSAVDVHGNKVFERAGTFTVQGS